MRIDEILQAIIDGYDDFSSPAGRFFELLANDMHGSSTIWNELLYILAEAEPTMCATTRKRFHAVLEEAFTNASD